MFPGITLSDVHAALAYYFENRAEIEADFRNDEEWARFAEANYPSLLREKLRVAVARSARSTPRVALSDRSKP
jgi:hypothetical protein